MERHQDMAKEKIILCWSGGKDSSMSLYELRRSGDYEVVTLLTTLTEPYDRISMHGVRRVLLEEQAAAVGLPLEKIFISTGASNTEYEEKMKTALLRFKSEGITKVAFGDIFLEDLRAYREANLAKVGMSGVFPIWKRETTELSKSFIAAGFKAVLTCVDTQKLDSMYAGRLFNSRLMDDLPPAVDPCGENGEFHSFVYDGPIFKKEVEWVPGERVLRDNRFCFFDLRPLKESVQYA